MRGQRGWRELAALGDRLNKFSGMIEGLIWSPRNGDGNGNTDNWPFEEVYAVHIILSSEEIGIKCDLLLSFCFRVDK